MAYDRATLIVASIALVVTSLTFLLKIFQDYYAAQCIKLGEAVKLAGTYEKAQAAASSIWQAKTELESWLLTEDDIILSPQPKAEKQPAVKGQEEVVKPLVGQSTDAVQRLDYADIFFLHRLPGVTLKLKPKPQKEMQQELERLVKQLEDGRQTAAGWWDEVVGKYKSQQLMHHRTSWLLPWTWLKSILGVPTEPFFRAAWAGRGKRHLELVEPLDLANWYSMLYKNKQPAQPKFLYTAAETEIRPPRYHLLERKAATKLTGEEPLDRAKYSAVLKKREDKYIRLGNQKWGVAPPAGLASPGPPSQHGGSLAINLPS